MALPRPCYTTTSCRALEPSASSAMGPGETSKAECIPQQLQQLEAEREKLSVEATKLKAEVRKPVASSLLVQPTRLGAVGRSGGSVHTRQCHGRHCVAWAAAGVWQRICMRVGQRAPLRCRTSPKRRGARSKAACQVAMQYPCTTTVTVRCLCRPSPRRPCLDDTAKDPYTSQHALHQRWIPGWLPHILHKGTLPASTPD